MARTQHTSACERCLSPFTHRDKGQRFCSGRCSGLSHPKIPAVERFWAKVTRGAEDECWPWTGGTASSGHGRFRTDSQEKVAAHRFAWELQNGPIPAGLCVCHHCDNPPCCNVRHFFLGTNQENSYDRHAKGRTRIGERNGRAMLTVAAVIQIRSATGLQREIAAEHGTTLSNVSLIRRRKTWARVA